MGLSIIIIHRISHLWDGEKNEKSFHTCRSPRWTGYYANLCMFAYENDIPRSTLSRIEIGDNEAKLVTLKKIAEGFGWSLSELFERIEEKLPNNFKIFDDEHY